jgi:type I restriction enzyme R subunit
VLLRPYAEYEAEYGEKVAELRERFPLNEQIIGEAAQKDFITLFGSILKLQNILLAFDEFAGSDPLSERDHQDYRSVYLDLYAQFRQGQEVDKETINDDIVFEIELVKQVEVNVDYILMLVEEYRKKKGWGEDKELKATIFRAVDAAPTLRNKRDLIEDFVESVSVSGDVGEEWKRFVGERQAQELEEIIASEGLRSDAAQEFVARAFRDGGIQGTGTAITDVLPPVSRFRPDRNHQEKKSRVLTRLGEFFERFSGLVQQSEP